MVHSIVYRIILQASALTPDILWLLMSNAQQTPVIKLMVDHPWQNVGCLCGYAQRHGPEGVSPLTDSVAWKMGRCYVGTAATSPRFLKVLSPT